MRQCVNLWSDAFIITSDDHSHFSTAMMMTMMMMVKVGPLCVCRHVGHMHQDRRIKTKTDTHTHARTHALGHATLCVMMLALYYSTNGRFCKQYTERARCRPYRPCLLSCLWELSEDWHTFKKEAEWFIKILREKINHLQRESGSGSEE